MIGPQIKRRVTPVTEPEPMNDRFDVRITVRIEFEFYGIEALTTGDAAVQAGDQVRSAMKTPSDVPPWSMYDVSVRRVRE